MCLFAFGKLFCDLFLLLFFLLLCNHTPSEMTCYVVYCLMDFWRMLAVCTYPLDNGIMGVTVV